MANGRHGQQRPGPRGQDPQRPQGPQSGGRRRGEVIRFEIPRRAAPGYITEILGDHHTMQSRDTWKDVPPGHRFQIYFHGMADGGEVEKPEDRDLRKRLDAAADQGDWDMLTRNGARPSGVWNPLKNGKRVALQSAAGMGRAASELLSALAARTHALRGSETWQRTAELIAPLATGLGNPHPVENGFAFLSPYGVPYLAGSGVKGVLRRAAEELALFETESPWSIAHVWALFGFDENSSCLSKLPEEMTQKEREKLSPVVEEQMIRWRGAYERWGAERAATDPVLAAWKQAIEKQLPVLPHNWREASPTEFALNLAGGAGTALRRAIHWQGLLAVQDAFPSPNATMAVDILNPHHRDYFEGNGAKSPHDAENPVPVFFLTVAPGARFTFSARSLPNREALWEAIGDWKALLDAAYCHARDWLGFGAKTAVGYGAMEGVSEDQVAASRAAVESARLRCEWVDVTVRELAAKSHAKEGDTLRGRALAEAWAALTDSQLKARALADIRARWEEKGWWDDPPGGAAKKARAIYDAGSGTNG